MNQSSIQEQLSQFQNLHTTGIAYELIREILIPDILGKELPAILYWSGKNLARKYPLTNDAAIIQFFESVGWGTLSITQQKNNVIQFELISDFITARNKSKKSASYQLEAGFLAQQYEQINQVVSEAYEDQKKRTNKVFFTVKWDKNDPIE
jgi:predicted hydrocarbon binding protein